MVTALAKCGLRARKFCCCNAADVLETRTQEYIVVVAASICKLAFDSATKWRGGTAGTFQRAIPSSSFALFAFSSSSPLPPLSLFSISVSFPVAIIPSASRPSSSLSARILLDENPPPNPTNEEITDAT